MNRNKVMHREKTPFLRASGSDRDDALDSTSTTLRLVRIRPLAKMEEKRDHARSAGSFNDHSPITILRDRRRACLQDTNKLVDCWIFRAGSPREVKGKT